jgi:hypothetical protein
MGYKRPFELQASAHLGCPKQVLTALDAYGLWPVGVLSDLDN